MCVYILDVTASVRSPLELRSCYSSVCQRRTEERAQEGWALSYSFIRQTFSIILLIHNSQDRVYCCCFFSNLYLDTLNQTLTKTASDKTAFHGTCSLATAQFWTSSLHTLVLKIIMYFALCVFILMRVPVPVL